MCIICGVCVVCMYIVYVYYVVCEVCVVYVHVVCLCVIYVCVVYVVCVACGLWYICVCVVYMYVVCVVYVCCIWCVCGKPMCFRSVQESEERGSGRDCLQTSPEAWTSSSHRPGCQPLTIHNKAMRLFFFFQPLALLCLAKVSRAKSVKTPCSQLTP